MTAEARWTMVCDIDATPGCRNGSKIRPYGPSEREAKNRADRAGWKSVIVHGDLVLDACPSCLPEVYRVANTIVKRS